MRLSRQGLRAVTLRQAMDDEDVYTWADGGETVRAALQPATGSMMTNVLTAQATAKVYGADILRMLVMYYTGPAALAVGMGVCVEVAPDAPCDYRIVAVAPWSGHWQATLAWISEARRG